MFGNLAFYGYLFYYMNEGHYVVVISAASNNKVVCEFDTKPLSCPTGTTIQIRTVNFGRTNAIVCKRDKHIDCYSTGRVTGNLARRCNGNDLCQVSADSGILGENPCPGIPKYLDILWDCNPLPTTTPPTTTTASTTTVSTTTAAANQNLGTEKGAFGSKLFLISWNLYKNMCYNFKRILTN